MLAALHSPPDLDVRPGYYVIFFKEKKSMTKKSLVKMVLLCALIVQVVVGGVVATGSSDAAGLCKRNAQDGCDNNGCEETGGVCGRAAPTQQASGGGDADGFAASPCWCLY